MPKKYIHIPLLFFFITALTGVWMRSISIMPGLQIISYDHILHGHSHIAILGWLFFAILIIYLAFMWKHLPHKKEAKWLLIISAIVTSFMFIAFLYQGYALYSIILSTLHIFTEYWAIIFIFKTITYHPDMPKTSRLFIKTGAIMLFISSFGPFGLGAIASMGLRNSPLFEMAIYFYLHFQYNGWLYYMLIGFFILLLKQAKIILNKQLLKWSFLIYTLAILPGFLLSILWYDLGRFAYLLSAIGGLGQFIGVGLFLWALYIERQAFKKSFNQTFLYLSRFAFIILLAKAMMELGLLIPSLSAIIYDTRHVVIGYLHLTLLGFISLSVLALFIQLKLVPYDKQVFLFGVNVFLIGFCLNEAVLFTSTLFTWLGYGTMPLHNSLLFIASLMILMSIAFMWLTHFYPKSKLFSHIKKLEA